MDVTLAGPAVSLSKAWLALVEVLDPVSALISGPLSTSGRSAISDAEGHFTGHWPPPERKDGREEERWHCSGQEGLGRSPCSGNFPGRFRARH